MNFEDAVWLSSRPMARERWKADKYNDRIQEAGRETPRHLRSLELPLVEENALASSPHFSILWLSRTI